MKVKFSNIVSYTPEWNGNRKLPAAEQVNVQFKVLPLGAYLDLVDQIQAAGLTGKVDTDDKGNLSKMRPIVKAAADILPDHVELFGLTDDAGSMISVATVAGFPAFLGLAVELLMKLVEVSSPSEDDEGN